MMARQPQRTGPASGGTTDGILTASILYDPIESQPAGRARVSRCDWESNFARSRTPTRAVATERREFPLESSLRG